MTPPFEGLGDLDLARGAPALKMLRAEDAASLEAMLFPPDDPIGVSLRYALAARGVDVGSLLRRELERGGDGLGRALETLASKDPLGAVLLRRTAGAASLLVATRPRRAPAPAGALASAEDQTAALARWAALPMPRAIAALSRVLEEYPAARAPLAGAWNPNAVLSIAVGWPPGALDRLASQGAR